MPKFVDARASVYLRLTIGLELVLSPAASILISMYSVPLILSHPAAEFERKKKANPFNTLNNPVPNAWFGDDVLG